MKDPEKIWSALNAIPAHNRETWVKAGMAIKAKLGDSGFSVWDEWSRTADNYSERDAKDVWRSFKDNSIGIGTLFYIARQYGYQAYSKAAQPILKPRLASALTKSNTGVYARELWLRSDWKSVSDHAYAKAKGIDWPAGAGRANASGSVIGKNADCIVVPIRDLQTDKVVAVQCINPEGKKQTFGPVSSNAFVCGNTISKSLRWFVVEGWADAVSMVFHHYQGNAVALAACGKSMMDAVAKKAAQTYQLNQIILVDDVA